MSDNFQVKIFFTKILRENVLYIKIYVSFHFRKRINSLLFKDDILRRKIFVSLKKNHVQPFVTIAKQNKVEVRGLINHHLISGTVWGEYTVYPPLPLGCPYVTVSDAKASIEQQYRFCIWKEVCKRIITLDQLYRIVVSYYNIISLTMCSFFLYLFMTGAWY